MAANEQEYFAEGVQAWLGVTLRSDVNGGFNSAEKLRVHDPLLAALLTDVFDHLTLDHFKNCPY